MELAWLYTALALLVATLIFLLKNIKTEVDAGGQARPAPVQAGPGGRRQPRRLRQQVILHDLKFMTYIKLFSSVMETMSRSYQLTSKTTKSTNDQELPPRRVSTPTERKLARKKRENSKKKKTREFKEKCRPVRGRRRSREKKS